MNYSVDHLSHFFFVHLVKMFIVAVPVPFRNAQQFFNVMFREIHELNKSTGRDNEDALYQIAAARNTAIEIYQVMMLLCRDNASPGGEYSDAQCCTWGKMREALDLRYAPGDFRGEGRQDAWQWSKDLSEMLPKYVPYRIPSVSDIWGTTLIMLSEMDDENRNKSKILVGVND